MPSAASEGVQEPPPAKRQKRELKYEESYLRSIPRASQYERSFMHRDVVTHVFATERNFLITASQDGHLKFWKKQHGVGVEFVKHFRCHLKSFSDIAVNHNGTLMATCCTEDKSAKVFDVTGFDMINMLRLTFHPRACCWVHTGSDLVCSLAISDANSGSVYIFDGRGGGEPIKVIEEMHSKPVILMDYNARVDVAVSVDDGGMVEYSSGTRNDYAFPSKEAVDWEYKTDTDLYEFAKLKQLPKCLKISPDGRLLTVVSSDRSIYIFNLRKAKILKKLDESLQRYIELGRENKGHGLQNVEWNRRVALEKELNRDPTSFQHLSISYDESSNFLIYPTPLGIRVYNIVTDEVVREIGKGENIRFIGVALCRALPGASEKLQGAATSIEVEAAENPNLRVSEPDPMIIACAHKKNRFYLFTNVEPFSTEGEEDVEGASRDVYNERPEKADTIAAVTEDTPKAAFSTKATIHTSYGDVHVQLFPDKCPKTVENWTTLARRGYYDGHQFHRVIKAFMIQTGDPSGRGTGGQSIWGGEFDDELHPSLLHDKPYRMSMANSGPNTNGSQFFITVVPCPWLDGKHTIFGEVTEGFSVVQKINQVPTFQKTGRPKEEVSVISITLQD